MVAGGECIYQLPRHPLCRITPKGGEVVRKLGSFAPPGQSTLNPLFYLPGAEQHNFLVI